MKCEKRTCVKVAEGGRRGRTDGVTLIELLLSVAILGVISVVVVMTLSVGVEAWRAGTSLADEARHADAVMEQVVMALKSAYYPESKDATYEYGFTHEDGGESPKAEDRISWVKIGNSLIGEDAPWAGSAHRAELFINTGDSDDGPGLYVKAWQLVGLAEDFDSDEDVMPLLISDQVISFDCRMKDPDYAEIPGEPFEWLDEWTASNRLPTHVEVTLAIQPLKPKDEPLEYVRLFELPMAALSWNPVQSGGVRGDSRSRGRGDAGTRGRGDAGTRGRGDAGARGNTGARRRGNTGARGSGDAGGGGLRIEGAR